MKSDGVEIHQITAENSSDLRWVALEEGSDSEESPGEIGTSKSKIALCFLFSACLTFICVAGPLGVFSESRPVARQLFVPGVRIPQARPGLHAPQATISIPTTLGQGRPETIDWAPPGQLTGDVQSTIADAMAKNRNKQQELDDTIEVDRIANIGRAIDTLRDQIPKMLSQEMDLSIFAEGIVLKDNRANAMLPVLATGKAQYAGFYMGLRTGSAAASLAMFSTSEVEIMAVRHLEFRKEITVKFSIVTKLPVGKPLQLDELWVFRYNDFGLIKEHRLDDVQHLNQAARQGLVPGMQAAR